MRLRSLLVMGFLGVALVGLAGAPVPAEEPADAKSLERLVGQLGSDSFDEREKATATLDKLGEPALPALRKAAAGEDAEVRKRAGALLAAIEKRVEGARHLAAKIVQLKCTDAPVSEVVADLRKQSGYAVVLHDPENKAGERKITLDTGKVTFWAALAQLCEKAGLSEYDPISGSVPPAGPGVPGGPPVPPGFPGGPVPLPAIAPAPAIAPLPPIRRGGVRGGAGAGVPARPAAAAVVEVEVKAVPAVPVPPPPPVAVPLPAPVIIGGPIMPGGGVGPGMPAGFVPTAPGQITLIVAKPKARAVDTATSVRVEAMPDVTMFGPSTDKQLVLALRISPEPKLQWQRTVAVRIDRAKDDAGQKLAVAEEAPNPGVPGGFGGFGGGGRVVIMPGGRAMMPGFVGGPFGNSGGIHNFHPVRLEKGEKASKALAEISGVITGEVLGAVEELVAVEDVLKAAGKEVKGKNGGKIKVTSVEKNPAGQTVIGFEFEQPAGVVPENGQLNPGAIQIMPAPIRVMPGRAVPLPVPAPAPLPKPVPAPLPAERPVEGVKEDAKAPEAKEAVKRLAARAVKPVPAPAPVAVAGIAVAGGGVAIAMPAIAYYGPGMGISLRDDKGHVLPAAIQPNFARAGAGTMEYQVIYTPQKGAGEPTKLIFAGRRPTSLNVPFTLKDVKLP